MTATPAAPLNPRLAANTRAAAARKRSRTAALPSQSTVWLAGFTTYVRWYFRRHFHALRLSGGAPPPVSADQPLVVFLNHAGWWDPLVCMLLREAFFPERRCHAPIDAAMLGRYRFFERLGFFGVEQHSSRGAVRFLQTAGAILAAPNTALWLTPQGRFGDVRERPVRFKSGIGHLAARVPDALFLPLAVEFVHWEERTPEALVRFGEPVGMPPEDDRSPGAWTERLEHALETTQDALAADSQSRDPARFRPLDRGTAGVGGVYDRWRRMQAWLQGREFDSRHGSR